MPSIVFRHWHVYLERFALKQRKEKGDEDHRRSDCGKEPYRTPIVAHQSVGTVLRLMIADPGS